MSLYAFTNVIDNTIEFNNSDSYVYIEGIENNEFNKHLKEHRKSNISIITKRNCVLGIEYNYSLVYIYNNVSILFSHYPIFENMKYNKTELQSKYGHLLPFVDIVVCAYDNTWNIKEKNFNCSVCFNDGKPFSLDVILSKMRM